MNAILPDDFHYMAEAIQLARKGWNSTSPNPRVGCVLVKDGRVIGRGFHERAGEAHAEVNALADTDTFAQGATAYVTLEPCSHHGKTPPCASALIEAGISRLVFGMQDPNPQVSGKGLDMMRAAGIEVVGPVLEADCMSLNSGFIKRMKTGMPEVFAKVASSLDGRTAMSSGESQWITGEEARKDVQRLRAGSCAIITGVGTVLQDDPSLNVRDETQAVRGYLRQPIRVVIDSELRLSADRKIVQNPGGCLVFYANKNKEADKQILEAEGVECILCAGSNGKVDLAAVVEELGKRQINTVMLEAGAKLTGAFLKVKLLDWIELYQAPSFLGSDARPLADLHLSTMAEKIQFDIKDLRKVGKDLRLTLIPNYNEG